MVTIYLVLGFVAYWPLLPSVSNRLFGQGADYVLSAWFIGWVPHAIAHGLNPFFTNSMFVPTGVNLAQNTESPLLGLIGAPLTEAFSPLVTTNVLMVLAMPVSATAAFVVLRKWKVWLPGAALGGLVYGFSAYMVGQGTAHLVFTFVPIPPFIALTVVSILQRKGSPWRLGFQLGLLVVAQYLISQEVLVDVAILTFAALVCVALRYPRRIQALGRAMVQPVVVALPVIAALLAYPVWMLVAGPQHATTPASPVQNPYRNDLLSFFVPGPLQKVSLGMGSLGNRLMAGPNPGSFFGVSVGSNPAEFDGYVGVVVLALAGFLVWRSRRSPRMQLASVLFLVAAVLSLGSYLVIDARPTHIPLPFFLLAHVPLVGVVLPSRFSLEVFMCLAAMIAFGLDDMHHHLPRPQWLTSRVFAGALVAALVVAQLPQWPYSTKPVLTLWPITTKQESALPTALRAAIPAGDPVTITYPYLRAFTPQPMEWQMDSGYTFRLLGGYAHVRNANGDFVTDPSVMSPPGLQHFLEIQAIVGVETQAIVGALRLRLADDSRIASRPLSPGLVSTTLTALSNYDVGMVIVDRSAVGSGPVIKLFDEALGRPEISAGQFSMWANWHK
ncbi:MAG: hypothetical protein ACRDYE_04270 [Acidimicrobiales bacterium]